MELADSEHLRPIRGWLILSALVVLLAAGCGVDTEAQSIKTGALTSQDLPGLLPDADTAGSVLGVTIDEVDERADLSQTFEHTDSEQLEAAHVGFYRAASESDSHVATGSASIQLALYETSDAAQAALETITGEGGSSVSSRFDVADLAEAGQGFVFDADASFTWMILRWDTLVMEMGVFHEPDEDLIEEARGLARQVRTNLSTIAEG